jgi:hypothetical protein
MAKAASLALLRCDLPKMQEDYRMGEAMSVDTPKNQALEEARNARHREEIYRDHKATEESRAKQATPHATLIEQLMNSCVPKTEREHAAVREIERQQHVMQRVVDAWDCTTHQKNGDGRLWQCMEDMRCEIGKP